MESAPPEAHPPPPRNCQHSRNPSAAPRTGPHDENHQTSRRKGLRCHRRAVPDRSPTQSRDASPVDIRAAGTIASGRILSAIPTADVEARRSPNECAQPSCGAWIPKYASQAHCPPPAQMRRCRSADRHNVRPISRPTLGKCAPHLSCSKLPLAWVESPSALRVFGIKHISASPRCETQCAMSSQTSARARASRTAWALHQCKPNTIRNTPLWNSCCTQGSGETTQGECPSPRPAISWAMAGVPVKSMPARYESEAEVLCRNGRRTRWMSGQFSEKLKRSYCLGSAPLRSQGHSSPPSSWCHAHSWRTT